MPSPSTRASPTHPTARRGASVCSSCDFMIALRTGEVAARGQTVLVEKIDLAKQYQLTKPGKYYVQFSGLPLSIGEPMTVPKDAEHEEYQMFVTGNSQFPSNILEIEVTQPNH